MTDGLETFIARLRGDADILRAGHEAVRQGAVLPLLGRLGWDRDDVREVIPGYQVGSERVDYCLRLGARDVALVEVVDADREVPADRLDRLLGLATQSNAPLTVLTTGMKWWLFGTRFEGSSEERLFCRLDLALTEPRDAAALLSSFFGRASVADGSAMGRAEERMRRARVRRMEAALWESWDALRTGEDDRLVTLLRDLVEAASGLRPDADRLLAFLGRVTRAPEQAVVPDNAAAVQERLADVKEELLEADAAAPEATDDDDGAPITEFRRNGHGGAAGSGTVEHFDLQEIEQVLAQLEAGPVSSADSDEIALIPVPDDEAPGGLPATNGSGERTAARRAKPDAARPSRWAARPPTGFSFLGEYRPVSSYGEILAGLASVLYRLHRPEFSRVTDLGGDRRTLFATNRHDLRSPGRVTGADLYVEQDLSPDEIIDCCQSLLELFDYDRDQLEIELEK